MKPRSDANLAGFFFAYSILFRLLQYTQLHFANDATNFRRSAHNLSTGTANRLCKNNPARKFTMLQEKKMARIIVEVPVEMHAAIKALAAERDTSIVRLTRAALRRELAESEKRDQQ
ncbi:hypothetical protein [Burkholderia contaminans]|uniref:hypothetical protein n=1 Tax=Burkholderia contaminans TaxID=488447 RepID=UPI00158D313F|nr:hypothetical protein [Burkholderia contaminans]